VLAALGVIIAVILALLAIHLLTGNHPASRRRASAAVGMRNATADAGAGSRQARALCVDEIQAGQIGTINAVLSDGFG
jgi:hypothetical protein